MPTKRLSRLITLIAIFAGCCAATTFSNCDFNHDNLANVADIQALTNEALGIDQANHDLNLDTFVNVVDIQIEINTALGARCIADPSIQSIAPNSGQQGVSGINATITGLRTSFTAGSVVSLGAGITVSNIAAPTATSLTLTLAVAGNASPGPRDVTVDGVTLTAGFSVTVPSSVSYTYDSQGRLATASYTSSSGALTVVTYSYDAAGNRTAVVAQ